MFGDSHSVLYEGLGALHYLGPKTMHAVGRDRGLPVEGALGLAVLFLLLALLPCDLSAAGRHCSM